MALNFNHKLSISKNKNNKKKYLPSHHLPAQTNPFPVNPLLQEHPYPPGVLLHVPYCLSQLWVADDPHSLISAKHKFCYKTFSWPYLFAKGSLGKKFVSCCNVYNYAITKCLM